jgi:hypothetical protein
MSDPERLVWGDGYQVPAASEVDRGKVLGEKVAPAGTIHGKAMMRYLPA